MNNPKQLNFKYSDYDEPHYRRRLEILQKHPEVRKLFGYDTRSSIIILVVVVVHFAGAWLLQSVTADLAFVPKALLIVASAYLVGALLSHWCAMFIHESTHNLCARSPLANRLMAMYSNLPMIIPIAMSFRRYHLLHHAYLGIDDRDRDLPAQFEVRFIKNNPILKTLWLLFYLLFYLGRYSVHIKPPNAWEILNFFIQMTVNVLIVYFLGWGALVYLFLSTWFGHGPHPIAAHFIHEHYVYHGDQETYSYYGPLNRICFNVGYHYEHHDFMNIPGAKLPELHRVANEYYRDLASHRSWTRVMLEFIFSRQMGPYKRLVRTYKTHLEARQKLSRLRRK